MEPEILAIKYAEYLKKEYSPMITTAGGRTYIISPSAVQNLRFNDNFLSFLATFKGRLKRVQINYDRIVKMFHQEAKDV